MGAHVQGDLEAAIIMAQHLEFIVVETGPRQVARDPKSSKIRKRVSHCRSKGARLGVLAKWSKSSKNSSQRRRRAAQA